MAYNRVHASMSNADASVPTASTSGSSSSSSSSNAERPLKVHWAQGSQLTSLAFIGAQYRLYALFDALVTHQTATIICQRISAWIKSQQALLFVPV